MSQYNQRFAQLQTFYLAGGGASIGDTSITLQSMLDIDGNALSMATDFGTKAFGTLEAGNGNLEEQISFSGLTNNSNGTVTLTGVKSVLFTYPYTETSGLAKTHAGSATFIISNTAGFYNELTSTANDEVITGLWQFPSNGNTPIIGTTYAAPTSDLQIPTKKYVDTVAVSGAPNSSESTNGISQLATKAQAAAGTSTGSTGARLVIPASMASATSSATTTAVITNTSGKIDSSFVDQTANYSWSGNTTLSGVVTITGTANFTGTTTIAGVTAVSGIGTTLTAAESITAGQPVASYYYQSDGGITFDNKTSTNGSFTTSGGNASINFTVGAGTNTVLLAFVYYSNSGSGTISSVAFDSVAMTQVDQTTFGGNAFHMESYRLFAPHAGTHAFTFTCPNNGQAWGYGVVLMSYSNVSQSAIDSHAIAQAKTAAITTVAPGALVVTGMGDAAAASTASASANTFNNNTTFRDGVNYTMFGGDSGIAYPAGATTVTVTNSSSGSPAIAAIGLAPVTTPAYGYVVKTSAANPANAANLNKYTGFVGFAQNSASVGQTVNVQINGRVTGLTSLTPSIPYYLADTAGTISKTAGTNTRKIGIPLDATTLEITNIW